MNILYIADPLYPYFLKQTGKYAPDKLYFQGTLPDPNQLMISVVGTRRMSDYGKEAVREIVSGLVKKGFWIVSGMAYGIDSSAHEAAIRACGKTIAVLGTGIDYPYTGSRKRLYDQICQNGCIVTDFPPGTPGYKTNFPLRNRIIAGLSIATVVVEAMERSGSFITAIWAQQIFNRDVFAVPGSIFYPRSRGTHRLIQKNMAMLAINADDICEDLSLWIQSKISRNQENMLTVAERLILKILTKPKTLDDICKETRLSPEEASSSLSLLELRGQLQSQGPWFLRRK